MPLLLLRNDITKVQADAIVNPANCELLEGSGTSRAIYLAAGEEKLAAACEKIGYCGPGKAVLTDAYDLGARYIIHAVGPAWIDGAHKEEEYLYSAYRESLLLAEDQHLESIAFPLLSAGNYGFPKDLAMKTAIRAISDFLMDHEMTVSLVLYDRDSVSVSKKIFAAVEEYIDDHYVEQKDEWLPGDEGYTQYAKEKYEAFLRMPEASIGADIPEQVPSPKQSRKPGIFRRSLLKETAPQQMPAVSPKQADIQRSLSAPARSLDDLINQQRETFSQMLLRLIDERGLKDSYVYKKANVDRRHFSKIRNDVDYAPNKKTVLAFAVALELTLDETKDLLMRAGFAISMCSRFDLIICYFIENRMYDIFEINETLFAYDQPILGG